jgi:hypothetical protein
VTAADEGREGVDAAWAGRPLPDPGFAGDDGAADAELAQALRELAAGAAVGPGLLARLASARLLVPVVAVLEDSHTGPDGRRTDKRSSMASVTVRAPDGRRSLVAFTSTAALSAWRADARPIAADGRRVAQAALAEGVDALVVDPAGPVPFAVADAELRVLALAADPTAPLHADPAVAAAVSAVCAGEPAVVLAALRPGEPTGVRVVVVADDTLSAEGFADLAARLPGSLAGSPALRARVEALQVAFVAPAQAQSVPAPAVVYRRR